jgi:hypothetical protein
MEDRMERKKFKKKILLSIMERRFFTTIIQKLVQPLIILRINSINYIIAVIEYYTMRRKKFSLKDFNRGLMPNKVLNVLEDKEIRRIIEVFIKSKMNQKNQKKNI